MLNLPDVVCPNNMSSDLLQALEGMPANKTPTHRRRKPQSRASNPPKPPSSRARLLKDAEAEELEAAELRRRQPAEAKKAEEKVLQLKSQRAQVAAKLAEWEATFRSEKGHAPTTADQQRSSQYKELTKLIGDLDLFITAAETGTSPALVAGAADESKKERGKLKAKMRRWDHDFERSRGRRPREEDRAASEEFLALRSRLQASGGIPRSSRRCPRFAP